MVADNDSELAVALDPDDRGLCCWLVTAGIRRGCIKPATAATILLISSWDKLLGCSEKSRSLVSLWWPGAGLYWHFQLKLKFLDPWLLLYCRHYRFSSSKLKGKQAISTVNTLNTLELSSYLPLRMVCCANAVWITSLTGLWVQV